MHLCSLDMDQILIPFAYENSLCHCFFFYLKFGFLLILFLYIQTLQTGEICFKCRIAKFIFLFRSYNVSNVLQTNKYLLPSRINRILIQFWIGIANARTCNRRCLQLDATNEITKIRGL